MIILLKGGTSSEREVSLWTAQSIADSLTRQGLEFQEIDAADADWFQRVVSASPSVVVIALHGPYGEDGTVQRLLEEKGIPHTGSRADVAAVTIDKALTKQRVAELGVATPTAKVITGGEPIEWESEFPVVVKPNAEGSSFGVSIVQSADELQAAVEVALTFDTTVLVEEYVQGLELTCGVIDVLGEARALPLVEIIPSHQFFDFDTKYTAGLCEEICPARVSSETTELVQGLSLKIYQALDLSQYARLDWVLRDGTPYFLEVNTLPGMTKTSLITKELAAAGIDFDSFIAAIAVGETS